MPLKPTIAILGATSHIAKGLIVQFLSDSSHTLHLYTRSSEKLLSFISSLGEQPKDQYHIHQGYEDLSKHSYECVINCVGVGTLKKLQGNYSSYFTVTEEYDNLVLNYLKSGHSNTHYISISSGAVYGRTHKQPASDQSTNPISVNHLAPEDYYGLVRLYTEAKHRSHASLSIMDLRLFSYFSRYIDLSDGYFITDLINCLLTNRVLTTDSEDMVRDYLHPRDFYAMIRLCLAGPPKNLAVDVVSKQPAKKSEILEYFSSAYGLQFRRSSALGKLSATGFKSIYCSDYCAAYKLGYQPQYSSLEALAHEAVPLLKPNS